jgi:hypothetical protein
MIYMRNITITTAKSATYLENVGCNLSIISSGSLGRRLEKSQSIRDDMISAKILDVSGPIGIPTVWFLLQLLTRKSNLSANVPSYVFSAALTFSFPYAAHGIECVYMAG